MSEQAEKKKSSDNIAADGSSSSNGVIIRKKPEVGLWPFIQGYASFKCSDRSCNKTWGLAFDWERVDDKGGIDCETCDNPCKLVGVKDERLKLDEYKCKCENLWHSIHVEENFTIPQDCDICGCRVLPNGKPKMQFGRHYWFKCFNDECAEKETAEWEDFSLEPQRTHRCECSYPGLMTNIVELNSVPANKRTRCTMANLFYPLEQRAFFKESRRKERMLKKLMLKKQLKLYDQMKIN